jgi:uncharacterized protein YjbJ (UPF0337 family)
MSEEQAPTRAPEGRSANAKLAAAVIGGYILGRTKKGGAAFKLASRLSGNQADPQAMSMAWTGVTQVAPSVQAAQIMQALGEVGGTTVKGTAETVSDTTRKVGGGVEGTTETVSDTTKKAGGGVKGALGKVSDTTKKAGGGVKGAVGKVTGRKKGQAEEPKPEEESDEGEEEGAGRGTSTNGGAGPTA